MSLFRRAYTTPRAHRDFEGVPDAGQLIPSRPTGTMRIGSVQVGEESAMRHSGVWAATRLRADLVSTFPCDVYRDFEGLALDMPKPPILVDTGGTEWDYVDWMWASQRDLDLCGNTIGLITERNAVRNRYYPTGLPSRIELQEIKNCAVVVRDGKRRYRINGKLYDPPEVYHERQYPIAGTPVGANPLVYAALSIGEYLSLQQHGLDWFAGGAVPKAWMRNTVRKMPSGEERDAAKQWYADTVRNGDLLVTGADWEYNMIQAEAVGMEWLEGRKYGLGDIARFFGVPADMIEAAVSASGSIRYANITQRHLEFLITKLGPAVIRREKYLSRLLPMPRYVKLNTDALLRMDPETRQKVIRSRVTTRLLTNTEARELDNLQPLTAADKREFIEIYGPPKGSTPPGDDAEPSEATEGGADQLAIEAG